jgi:hypothetical protein
MLSFLTFAMVACMFVPFAFQQLPAVIGMVGGLVKGLLGKLGL